jgi:hypothetical protein
MKLCLYGVSGIPLGKHNVRDPRLDQADRLVEAKKKTYVQIETVDEEALVDADAILVTRQSRPDLLLKDLEFVDARLTRNPTNGEHAALSRLLAALEQETTVRDAPLSAEERQAVAIHRFVTDKPVVLADEESLAESDAVLLRAYREAGYISFLTVGGKENRAWKIRRHTTAWEAASAIHSDIQRGFIRAEIIGFDDFLQAGSESQAKRNGKLRLETRQYVVQDYDLVNFRFNK